MSIRYYLRKSGISLSFLAVFLAFLYHDALVLLANLLAREVIHRSVEVESAVDRNAVDAVEFRNVSLIDIYIRYFSSEAQVCLKS